MKGSITIALRRSLAARVDGQMRWWQRRLPGRMQAGDNVARQAGWSITSTRFGGRIYRDPRFGQLSAARVSQTPQPGSPVGVRGRPARC